MSHDCNLSIQKAETGLGVRVKPCLIQPKQEEHQIVYFLLFIFYHEKFSVKTTEMTINSQKLKWITCAHKNTRWPQCSCLSRFNRNNTEQPDSCHSQVALIWWRSNKTNYDYSKNQNNLYCVGNTDKKRVLKEPLRTKIEIYLNVN